MFTFINSPLEQFEIQTILGVSSPIFNITFLNWTTFSLYVILTLGLYYFIIVFPLNKTNLIANNWTIVTESLYATIHNMVISQIGKKGEVYFPLIYSLFVFILFSNLISMIPYNFAVNGQLIFTVSLSMTLWLGITIMGFRNHSLKYFGLFVPSGTSLVLVPLLVLIEGISNIARSLSLGLRLGANILSGHLLLTILSGLIFDFMSSSIILFFIGFIPLSIVLGIVGLEFAIGAIQAYVFCILASSYINDAVNLH